MDKKQKSNLTEEEKAIMVDGKTEPPFSGVYNDFYSDGIYVCKACELKLFDSGSKFNSGCGWPSFDDAIEEASAYLLRNEQGVYVFILLPRCPSRCI